MYIQNLSFSAFIHKNYHILVYIKSLQTHVVAVNNKIIIHV